MNKTLLKTIVGFGCALCMASSAQAGTVDLTTSFSAWLNDVGGPTVTTSHLGADSTNVSSVSLNGGGSFTTSAPLSIFKVGSSWATWSGGYTGQVLYTNGVTSVTLAPSNLAGLGFEVEPNPFATYTVTTTLSGGQTISDSVSGYYGSQFFGYYGSTVTSLTISSAVDFAVGNFIAPSGIPTPTPTTTPIPAAIYLVGSALAGVFGFSRCKTGSCISA